MSTTTSRSIAMSKRAITRMRSMSASVSGWSRSPLIIIAIPIATTTSPAGAKIRSPQNPAWRAICARYARSLRRCARTASVTRIAPPPSHTIAARTCTVLKTRYHAGVETRKTIPTTRKIPAAASVVADRERSVTGPAEVVSIPSNQAEAADEFNPPRGRASGGGAARVDVVVQVEDVLGVVLALDLDEPVVVRSVRIADRVARVVVAEVVEPAAPGEVGAEAVEGLPRPRHVRLGVGRIDPHARQEEVVPLLAMRDGRVAHADARDGAVEVLEEDRVERRRRRLEALDREVDQLVVERPHEARLPVVERAAREAVVEQRVHDRVRHRPDVDDERAAEVAQRREVLLRLLG